MHSRILAITLLEDAPMSPMMLIALPLETFAIFGLATHWLKMEQLIVDAMEFLKFVMTIWNVHPTHALINRTLLLHTSR